MATRLTNLESIEQIISEMTVAEKAKIVIGGSPFHTEAMEKYGIPSMSMLTVVLQLERIAEPPSRHGTNRAHPRVSDSVGLE